jgi:hypothetical protein
MRSKDLDWCGSYGKGRFASGDCRGSNSSVFFSTVDSRGFEDYRLN